jgi:hypothetical protein
MMACITEPSTWTRVVATWGGLGRVPGGDAVRLSFGLVKEIVAGVPVGCVNAFTQLRVFTEKRPEWAAALPMHVGSPGRRCAIYPDALMVADLPEWWGARHAERMGNTPTSSVASPPDHQGRLLRRRRPPVGCQKLVNLASRSRIRNLRIAA